MKPELKWLILRGTVPQNGSLDLGPKSLPEPFKPLAFGYYEQYRAKGGLLLNEESLYNKESDLAAQFGRMGTLTAVPKAAQVILPAKAEFKLRCTDLANTAANLVILAILGVQYTGLKELPPKPGTRMAWFNLHDTVLANSSLHLVESLQYAFSPVAMGYKSTAVAQCQFSIDEFPFANDAAELGAMFGQDGLLVRWPEETLRVYENKISFDAYVSDLSGANNLVSISWLGTRIGLG